MSGHSGLSIAEVKKVAQLSRLALSDQQIAACRTSLSAVLGYMERLKELDLGGVEPLSNPAEMTNRFFEDAPGPTLGNECLMAIVPKGAAMPPFIRVPKVLGDAGGA